MGSEKTQSPQGQEAFSGIVEHPAENLALNIR